MRYFFSDIIECSKSDPIQIIHKLLRTHPIHIRRLLRTQIPDPTLRPRNGIPQRRWSQTLRTNKTFQGQSWLCQAIPSLPDAGIVRFLNGAVITRRKRSERLMCTVRYDLSATTFGYLYLCHLKDLGFRRYSSEVLVREWGRARWLAFDVNLAQQLQKKKNQL